MGKALELLERAYDLMDSGDGKRLAAEFDRIFAPAFELRTPVVQLTGRDAIGWWLGFHRACPGHRHRIDSAAEQSDLVGVAGTLIGKHTGPLARPDGSAIPPTGRDVRIGYAHLAWLEEERFSQWHVYFDPTAFLAQLGLVPEPAAA
jgi:hypothetical protein